MSSTTPIAILQINDDTYKMLVATFPNHDIYQLCDELNTMLGTTVDFSVFGEEDNPDYIGIQIAEGPEILINQELLDAAQQEKTSINHPLVDKTVLCVIPNSN